MATPAAQQKARAYDKHKEEKADEFAAVATNYAKFRPHYPAALVKDLLTYYNAELRAQGKAVEAGQERGLAVDVGTGSGQLANALAEISKLDVVGIDKSEPQLEQARESLSKASADLQQRVRFAVGTSYDMGVKDSSADIVAAAQAAHWFDLDKYFQECDRALRDGGVWSVMGYGICSLQSNDVSQDDEEKRLQMQHERAQEVFAAFYKSMENHWPGTADRYRLDTGFIDLQLPDHYHKFQRRWYPNHQRMTLGNFLSYVRTWSSVNAHMEKNLGDPTLQLEKDLLNVYGAKAVDDVKVHVVFPFFLINAVKAAAPVEKKVQIVPFEPKDGDSWGHFEDVYHIYSAVLNGGISYPQPPAPSRASFQRHWLSLEREKRIRVALLDGQVVGTYTLDQNHPGHGSHVSHASFMVSPPFNRRGIGRLMGEDAIALATQMGYTAMQFNLVTTANAGAVKLWQSLGFSVVGVLPGAFRTAAGDVDAFVMYKWLGKAAEEAAKGKRRALQDIVQPHALEPFKAQE